MKCLFTECFGGFQSMQSFNEREPGAVGAHDDRQRPALVEYARGDSSTRF
jgi:hypothetical protein